MPKREEVRLCAICGKPGADYGYRTALRWLGLPNWQDDKAHTVCVRNLQKKQKESSRGLCL